jgi:sugar lactone lactonase YvrE
VNKTTKVLIDNLGFPEGPRWHNGKLWFSDFRLCRVCTVDLSGKLDVVLTLNDQPSGLGWHPDGDLLVVSMIEKKLLKFDGKSIATFADLSQLASHWCNDMAVDAKGNAYIGNFGAPPETPAAKLAEIILVRPNGEAEVVARDMVFPNGPVITPDGKTLIVAETYAARLTAFDIEIDGTLANRRVWAQFDDLGTVRDRAVLRTRVMPDGTCLDAEGAIWIASPNQHSEVIRVKRGGEILERIIVDTVPYACMLGGEDGKTLFVLTSDLSKKGRVGKIETVSVDVPAATSNATN